VTQHVTQHVTPVWHTGYSVILSGFSNCLNPNSGNYLVSNTCITHVLVNHGCSAHLLKELSKVCTSGQVDQACGDGIRKHLSETSADASLIAGVDLFELTRSSAIISKSFSTNRQQNRQERHVISLLKGYDTQYRHMCDMSQVIQ
jgi:hypothetical protein